MSMFLALLLAAAGSAAAAEPAGPVKPHIYSRADWGAPKGTGSQDKKKVRIVVHHSDNPVTAQEKALTGEESLKAAVAHAKNIRAVHRMANGWRDIGYHYIVDWEGRVFEGRPVQLRGAHTDDHNTGSIGIVLMGVLHEDEPTAKQLIGLRGLTAWLLKEHGIEAKEIYGHRDFNNTECPGRNLYDKTNPGSPLILVRNGLLAEEKLRRRLRTGLWAIHSVRSAAALLPAGPAAVRVPAR